ncbi:MAG: HD domain-containing protein [Deltaproteobacteria bacterium]|nr:HD domain-containing protein [Deltaproteobacteria bacterium]
MTPSTPYEVRCPLHGTIPFQPRERALMDHPLVQRLRSISQLGFASLVYPGATHSRFTHALGVMHLAGKVFDQIAARSPLADMYTPAELAEFRQVVRVAGLLHDAGHFPFSHAFEPLLPLKHQVGLPPQWFPPGYIQGQANHEDYSVAAVYRLATETPALLSMEEAQDASSLIHQEVIPSPRLTGRPGVPAIHPLLRGIVSGEIDADRMDYLRRDSHYAGVSYGLFDLDRLIQGMGAAVLGDRLVMTLRQSSVYAYENFLMARFHMAMQVYFHKTILPFDHYLRRAVETKEISFPLEGMEGLLAAREDTVGHLLFQARQKPWAGKIVRRVTMPRLIRLDAHHPEAARQAMLHALEAANIPFLRLTEERRLSSLGEQDPAMGYLYVEEQVLNRTLLHPLSRASQLLQHYNHTFRIDHIHCDQENLAKAESLIRPILDHLPVPS